MLAGLAWACGGTVSHSGSNGGAGTSGIAGSGGSTSPAGKSCDYDGKTYANGEVVPMGECSQCRCADGEVSCTLLPCDPSPGCKYGANFYDVGESFPAADGCNSCSCGADLTVSCTEIGCPHNACQMLEEQYVELLDSAAKCTQNEECTVTLPSYLPCGCGRRVTDNDMMLTYQASLIAEQYKMQCPIDDGCPDCPTLQAMGHCYRGYCVSEAAPQ